MVAGSIPNQGNAAVWTLVEQVFEKGNGAFRITRFIALDETFLGVEVHCPMVSLLTALVDHGNFDTFVCFTSDIPTQISPIQMAFILEEHNQLL